MLNPEHPSNDSEATANRADTLAPVGSIIAWYSFGDAIQLPADSAWIRCDGQTIDDPLSPLNGKPVPNLNAERRFLRGGTLSGAFEEDQIEDHRHEYKDYYYVDEMPPDPKFATPIGDARGRRVDETRTSQGVKGAATGETRPKNMSVVWIVRIK